MQNKESSIRVLAIDPGYERMGVAILEKNTDKETLIFSDCIKTQKTDLHSIRLNKIGEAIEELIKKYQPKYLAIETLYFNSNQKTVIKVAESRGVVLFQAKKQKLDIQEFTPLEIKVAVTGYGRATKAQIIDMIPRLVAINKDISHDDEYDAIATGVTFFAYQKSRNILSTN